MPLRRRLRHQASPRHLKLPIGGSSDSGEPIDYGHTELVNSPVSPPHVLTESREPRELQAGVPGGPGDGAAPVPTAPEAAMEPAPAPPLPTGRPVTCQG